MKWSLSSNMTAFSSALRFAIILVLLVLCTLDIANKKWEKFLFYSLQVQRLAFTSLSMWPVILHLLTDRFLISFFLLKLKFDFCISKECWKSCPWELLTEESFCTQQWFSLHGNIYHLVRSLTNLGKTKERGPDSACLCTSLWRV